MKGYQVTLYHGGTLYLEAEKCTADSDIAFYRDGEVFARFDPDVVDQVTEYTPPSALHISYEECDDS
jgi:hypothetical protein